MKNRKCYMINAKCLVFLLLATGAAAAEEWGAYSIVPASAPALVLEAGGEGSPVTHREAGGRGQPEVVHRAARGGVLCR